jgi:hypothetical protein
MEDMTKIVIGLAKQVGALINLEMGIWRLAKGNNLKNRGIGCQIRPYWTGEITLPGNLFGVTLRWAPNPRPD